MENGFQWNDALVKEMVYSRLIIPDHYLANVQKCLDDFKASKTLTVKDYEILEYRYIQNNENKPDLQVIEKVRRLSDGSVFQIGTTVHDGFTDTTITSIVEKDKYVLLIGDKGSILLEYAKLKQPIALFTEDGVEIFDGSSKAYPVFIKEGFGYEPFNFINQRWTVDVNANYFNSVKYFSTEYAAKNYALMYKVSLSPKDITELLFKVSARHIDNFDKYAYNGELVSEIVELAKQKINQ